MAITTKTITGKIVIPGTTTGIRVTVTATPMTDSRGLTFPADDTLSWGPVVATTDVAGVLPATFKIPTNSDQQAQLLWRFTAEPIDKYAGLPKSWLMGEYTISGTGTVDLADLIDVDVLGINTTTYVTIQNYVAAAQAAATAAAAGAESSAASATLAQTLVTSDLGTSDGQTRALIEDPNSQTGKAIEQVFNIRRFGAAVGNTAAANQTAIQDALDTAGVSGGTVYVPPGTFLHNDAFTIPSNVHLRGSGIFSILKTTDLAAAATDLPGHRQIDATNKTGFRISDLTLDAGEMTVFTAGMRSILCKNSTNYAIERVHFRTPGAAVASVGSSHFTIDRAAVDVVTATGITYHDGVIDHWAGCHDFKVLNPTVNGNSLGKVPILVTGEDGAGLPTPCYNFTISDAQVFNAKTAGIWINGREGINHTFTIDSPLVDGVADYHGIILSDVYAWALSSPVVKNVARNGIKVYTESDQGGVTGGDDGTISSPVVYNANTTAQPSGEDGAGIAILGGTNGVTVTGPRVKGTQHTYALYFAPTVTDCFHSGGSYQTGTIGKVANDPAGGIYTPTVTGVANVATVTAYETAWSRDGDLVTVRGSVVVTPSAGAATATQVGISLPVASNLGSTLTHLFGTAATAFDQIAAISADTANDRAQLQFPAPGTASYVFYYSFAYRVL